MSLNKISGDDAWMDPPVPIPNTVVKHPEAESTCLVTGWEDRKPLVKEGAVARKHFRADSPVFFDLNHGHLTLAIIMA